MLLTWILVLNFVLFLETESHFVTQAWSAMVQSWLIATSASWVQTVLPQPPE